MSTKQYDEQIARIMSKIEAMKDKEFDDLCGEWPPVWEPPMSEKKVAAFEKKHGIRLPEDYRYFITTVAASGSQPFYGLEEPGKYMGDKRLPELGKPFAHSLDKPVIMIYMTEEELEEQDEEEYGFLPICTEGCGMYSILIVNSDDPEVYGTVWFFDYANDFGTAPMRDEKTGKPFRFLDWLEYWADRTAKLNEDEYFSFGDAMQIPEPPDNPDICGRKMGWIK